MLLQIKTLMKNKILMLNKKLSYAYLISDKKSIFCKMLMWFFFSERFVKINIYRKISGCHYLYKKENSVHKSSAVSIYFQCGIEDTLPNILLETLVHILSEPCLNILRTREQLGKTSKT